MFRSGLYQLLPPFDRQRASAVILCLAVNLLILIAAWSAPDPQRAQAGSVISPLTTPIRPSSVQSPLPTPTPAIWIEATSPRDGAGDVSRRTALVIRFGGAVDRLAIERGFKITPSITGTLAWQDRTLTFTPASSWIPGTTYQVDVRDLGRVSFTIRSLVRDSQPSRALDWREPITITFSEPLDRASVEAALSIDPVRRGTFQWTGESLVFAPRSEWDANTTYTINLSPTIKTASSETLLTTPLRLLFRSPTEIGTLSFGQGPNVQVVNPAGQRAIQFMIEGSLLRPMTVRLYTLSIEQFLDRYTSSFRGVGPQEDKHVAIDDLPVVREWRQSVNTPNRSNEVILPADLQPGLYVLTIDQPAATRDELIMLYTHDTLVLKQADGYIGTWASRIDSGALADMRIRIFDRDATLLAEGQTDRQGLFLTQVPIDPQPLIVIGERDGEITASGLSNEWTQRQWDWWWQPVPKGQLTRAYIYTERPIYRPGQTVNVKVIARYDNDAVYSRIPLEWDVIVRLRDARDNVIEAKTLHVNEYGTLNTSFDLAESGTVGAYHIEAQIKDDVHRQLFKVEDYRKPEYEVIVHTDRTNVVNHEPVSVTADVRTYFGAPVADAAVELVTYARGYEWWWYGEEDTGFWTQADDSKLIGHTDAQGRFTVALTPRVYDYLFDDYRHAAPALIEATVSDESGQAISASTQVTLHDGLLALSASLSKHMYEPGEDIPVDIVARDIDGQPQANEPVTVEVQGWSQNSGKYDRGLAKAEGRTDRDGALTLNVTAPRSDWYRVEITGRDSADRMVTTATWLWVYDQADQWSRWYGGDSGQVQISADKDRYVSGDTAQLLIRTPISSPALLSIERGRLRRAQTIQLTAPTTLVPVTLQDDDAPNVYVSVNVYQPNERDTDRSWQSIPDATLLTARTNLSVSADQRRLSVSIEPDHTVYGPREAATFTIQTTGVDGQPAPTELSLALVDESIYALSQELAKDPFEAFYAERDDRVQTYDSLRPVRYFPCECGGGGGLLGNPRFNFPDTAYWNPTITTDANGRAVVKVTLPDSLTRWRIVVRAVTADEFPRVGEATASITTTQPIVIRPELPRSLVQGDQVLLSAVIHNNTDRPRTANVWIDSDGLSLPTLDITRAITIEANSSSIVGWWAEAKALGTVTVTMCVKADQAADAVLLTLPVVPLAVPEVQAIIGDLTSSVEHTITLPQGFIAEASTLQIDLSPSIAASVLDGLAYLTGYPFGCVEQTMSKALPNAVVGRALNVLGVSNPRLSADLPRKVSAGLQRLYGYQHNDGGWGWWFDDSTDDYQTAYVLFGLAMTKQAGYTVDEGVITRGAEYLAKQLSRINEPRTKAYALFALALTGHGDLKATRQMTDTAALDAFSRAGLAIALHELGDEARTQQWLDQLIAEANITDDEAYWNTGQEDGHYHQKTMSSATRSTALVLNALVRIEPDQPIVPKVVRWLMARRSVEGWGTTQETAYAVVALTDYLRSSRELNAGSSYRILVNDKLIGEGTLSAGEVQHTLIVPGTRLEAGPNQVRIARAESTNRLYYKITRRSMTAGSADRAAGPITITRAYVDPKTDQPLRSVTVGDLVKVQLRVTLPDEGWYVAIEDPLPGGLEGLNEHLNTTSFAAKPGYYYGEGDEFFYPEYGYNNKEVRADRVVFFVTRLDRGTHTFTYLARTTRSGTFNALPAQAYLMYAPEQWGRSASDEVLISANGSRPSAGNSLSISRRLAVSERP